jgi:predicted secreted protein
MITLDEHADGREIELLRGDELEVVLPANRTTGFRWRLEPGAEPVLAAVNESYETPGASAPGGGGTHRWRFRAEQPGRGTITLALRRSWLTTGPEARTFRLHVDVPGPPGLRP